MAGIVPPFLFVESQQIATMSHCRTGAQAMTTENAVTPAGERETIAERFRSSSQVLALPEGLYLVSVRPRAQVDRVVNGVSFPAAQLSCLPQPGTAGLKFLQNGELVNAAWLNGTGQAVMVVPAGPAPLLITNYLFGSELQVCLDLEIKRLNNVAPAAQVGLRLHAHIQQVGPVSFAAGQWAAAEDAPFWIEALHVETSASVGQLLQYRVPGSSASDGNWTSSPLLLGTPGGRPLSGIAFRLMPPLSQTHRVIYGARFLRHGEMEAADGEPCRSPQPQDPLIAVRVAIVAR